MAPRSFVPLLVALVLVATTITAAGASGGHHPLGGSVETSTPPGAATTVTSGAYDNDIQSADVLIDTDTMSPDTFKVMVFALMSARSKSKRLVVCATVAAAHMEYVRERLAADDAPVRPETVESIAGSRGAAYALMCMNMARLMAEIEAEGPPARATSARPRCDVLPVQLRVRTERIPGGGFRVVPRGGITASATSMPVRTTCASRGTHLTMRLTAPRRAALRAVAGKRLVIGVANPSANEETADITVGFKGR